MRVSQFRSPGVKFRPKPKLCLGFATVTETETEAETALRAVSAPKPKPKFGRPLKYMLRGIWQALNCLSIHATYCVIIAAASPGETKTLAAVRENGDFLHLRFE